ncbi:hypothetical protein NEOLEDRAFT_1026415, partial [Neolentinus lepideus HHB14362 ss-1]
FICNEDGVIIDSHHIQDISNGTWDFLHCIQKIGEATLTWETISLHVKNAYYTVMKNSFHELAYCNNNWKAQYVISDIYPVFSKNHIK